MADMSQRPGARPIVGIMIIYAGCLLAAGIMIGLWMGG
jgi:hypothetical protein